MQQALLPMQYAPRLEALVTVTYLLFTDGATWWVSRHAGQTQQLARNLSSREQALRLAQVDSRRWPGCERHFVLLNPDGSKTVLAVLHPGDEVEA